jgi:starch-binding outer membrane protein, SusD/RagB family
MLILNKKYKFNKKMKKKFLYIVFSSICLFGCSDSFLDRQPLDAPATSNFFSNEAEIKLGLTGVYNASFWQRVGNVPDLKRIEAATDLVISRKADPESLIAQGDNGPFINGNAWSDNSWGQGYRVIVRANDMLDNMKRGEATTPKVAYARMRAEALTLRAWAYFNLMVWYGDVVFYTTSLKPEEYETQTRTPVETVAKALYADLDEAYKALDFAPSDKGRVNKGFAYGLKARLAMLIKDYATASAACKTIIDSGQYGLNPSYPNLFTLAGQNANAGKEIIWSMVYPSDNPNISSWMSVGYTPRQTLGSQSNNFPTQAMVDKFECTDGKRLDESPLYDAANPSRNRDKRLGWTLAMPNDTFETRMAVAATLPYVNPNQRFIYTIHKDSVFRFNWNTQKYDAILGNPDFVTSSNSVWQFGSTGAVGGVGYIWRKYTDPAQYQWELKTGYIVMRYAEILLMYAEAQLEQGITDATVVNNINAVKIRSGQPATTATTQAKLRQQVRRERAVEFAIEGLRLFDIRRWGIVLDVMNTQIVGAAKNPTIVPENPTFGPTGSVQDLNDIPNYSASVSKRISSRNEIRVNTAKHLLWPIPQGERDKNPKLTQNSNW